MSKTLKLTLKKHWFDLIEKGIKTEEYRELKDYWHKRMKVSPSNTRPFDFVEFTNGYNKQSPQITFELVNIRLDTGIKLHEKVANQRRDFLHKESFKLVSENQTIAIEDLNVKGMLKNHCLAKSISDVGWSMFTTMLEYKCEWYGVNLLKIGRFEPSSKTCSNCGTLNKELTLKDRDWTCKGCGTHHDRDINAAVNIKNFALRNYVFGTNTKNRNELPTLVGVLTSEAHPIGSAVGG